MTDEELNQAEKNLHRYLNERWKPGIVILGVAKDKITVMVQHDLMNHGELKMLERHLREWKEKNSSVNLDVHHVGQIVLAKTGKK